MDAKRALLTGALLWVVSFFVGLVLLAILGTYSTAQLENDPVYAVSSLALLAILTAVASAYYFRGKVRASLKEGFLLGIVFFATGMLLDFTIILPYAASGGDIGEIVSYYKTPLFLASVVLVISVPSAVGSLKLKKGSLRQLKQKPRARRKARKRR